MLERQGAHEAVSRLTPDSPAGGEPKSRDTFTVYIVFTVSAGLLPTYCTTTSTTLSSNTRSRCTSRQAHIKIGTFYIAPPQLVSCKVYAVPPSPMDLVLLGRLGSWKVQLRNPLSERRGLDLFDLMSLFEKSSRERRY